MQTYKRKTDFTGYIMLKCSCGHTSRVNVGIYAFKGYASDGKSRLDLNAMAVTCPDCQQILRVAFGKPLYGTYVPEIICNSKCTGATGHTCECSCGGKNHGANWSI